MIPRITFLLAWVHDTLNTTLYKMFLTQRENFLSLPVPIKKINSPVKLQESFNKTRNFPAFFCTYFNVGGSGSGLAGRWFNYI